MTRSIGILGEIWERPFAWATFKALRSRLGSEVPIYVPDYLGPPPESIGAVGKLEFVACGDGFIPIAQARISLAQACRHEPFIEIRAGSFPTEDREFALSRPVHAPPAFPNHCTTQYGRLTLHAVDTGDGYFQAIDRAAGFGPLWRHYGQTTPVFAFNTSEFNEPPPPPCDVYAILGSGLLGLKLIADSSPPPHARIVVYDINAAQLEWVNHVLARCDAYSELDELIGAFSLSRPNLHVRSVLPHEEDNATAQRSWYRLNRHRLANLRRHRVSFVHADVMTNPGALLEVLPHGRAFIMYLDLFMVWHISGPQPWVADLRGMARSFEAMIRSHVGREVCFTPTTASQRFQLHPASPFIED